jgi:hypothetical protein
VGLAALSFQPFEATYASVLNMPLAPWLELNNTVVVGSLLMGLYIAYPVFWFTRLLFKIVRRSPAETMS